MSSQELVTSNAARSPWRSVGVWFAVAMVLYTFSNVARAGLDPRGFADFFYAQSLSADNTAFVWVYAVRTLFLAVFGGVLILQKKITALATFTLVAILMPLGDAALAAASGAPIGRVIAHLLIAALLLVTWILLRRWTRGAADENVAR
jgi:hypothetical protein